MKLPVSIITVGSLLVVFMVVAVSTQRGGVFRASRDHPAIQYSSGTTYNVVSELNQQLQDGAVTLKFEGRSGYLRSALEVFGIPVESQLAVFSRTSFQEHLVSMQNPRAIYFTDNISVAFVRDADVLEVAVHDMQQGSVFYTLQQAQSAVPQFQRNEQCLACHLTWDTLGVPGLQAQSMFPLSSNPNAYATGFFTDHRSRLEDRWGGWYVTGMLGPVPHMGNVPVNDVDDPNATRGLVPQALDSLKELLDLDGYPSAYSDVAALMVLNHQVHMTNLITRIGWESRLVLYREQMMNKSDVSELSNEIRDAVVEFVDYLFFIDEVPLLAPVQGASGFMEQFSARGPRDRYDRSLRELDLQTRLMRYPCSYMIYTEAFDALPELAKDVIYERMWNVLSGKENDYPYTRFSQVDRQAIIEILRDTKSDLPSYFDTAAQ